MNLTVSPSIAPIPNHGVVSVADVAANPSKYAGGMVTVPGTYLHSASSLYDSSSIVTSMVPGPIAGAAALKLDGLSPELVATLSSDVAAGTGERWGDLIVTGVVEASKGVATLRVADAELQQVATTQDPDAFGFVQD